MVHGFTANHACYFAASRPDCQQQRAAGPDQPAEYRQQLQLFILARALSLLLQNNKKWNSAQPFLQCACGRRVIFMRDRTPKYKCTKTTSCGSA